MRKTTQLIVFSLLSAVACDDSTKTTSPPTVAEGDGVAVPPDADGSLTDDTGSTWSVWGLSGAAGQIDQSTGQFVLAFTVRQTASSPIALALITMLPTEEVAALPRTWASAALPTGERPIALRQPMGGDANNSPLLSDAEVVLDHAPGGGLRVTIRAQPPFADVTFDLHVPMYCSSFDGAGPTKSGTKGPNEAVNDPDFSTTFCQPFASFR